MTWLIVPDIHEQIEKLQNTVLKRFESEVDNVVFLGDYMDTFKGLTDETKQTIHWLADNIDNPKYTFLWGNHDLHYAFPFDGVICSGFHPTKLRMFRETLTDNLHFKKIKLHTWVGTPGSSEDHNSEWLCSHAGVHPYTIHPVLGYDKSALVEIAENAMYKLRYTQQVDPFLAPGVSRGGYARVGGITWMDWNELVPIEGLNQIVGHSNGKKVRKKDTAGSSNYCIDTHLNHVIMMDDTGHVKVEEV